MRKQLVLLLCIIITAFITGPVYAALSSDIKGVVGAEADFSSGVTALKSMSIELQNASDNKKATSQTKIAWTNKDGVNWKVADQYILITYQANQPSWGIQIWTENTNTDSGKGTVANPKWVEKPADSDGKVPDMPAGLVGAKDVADYIAVPLAWKALSGLDENGKNFTAPSYSSSAPAKNEFNQKYTEPTEVVLNDMLKSIELYQVKESTDDGTEYFGKYCWVVDRASEKYLWTDSDKDEKIDDNEVSVVDAFVNGDDYLKVVDYLGISTCSYDKNASYILRNNKIYKDSNGKKNLYLILAAKLKEGTVKSVYSTNTLTLELFHE